MENMNTTADYEEYEYDEEYYGYEYGYEDMNTTADYPDFYPPPPPGPPGPDPLYMKVLPIASAVIYSLVFVLGVLGNGVVIWVTGFKMKKTVNTVWYLNLAVADFLVTAFLPLQITYKALDSYWPFGRFMCKMDAIVFYMNMYASIFTLVVISVDRCVCVVCPVWAQNHRSVRKASWVSLGVWVLALALSSPYFIFKDTKTFPGGVVCRDMFDPTGNGLGNYRLHLIRLGAMDITRFLMGFVVPFTVIVSCYSVIIYRLRNNRSLAGQSGRSFKIMAAVITTFFLCWAPYHIMNLIDFVVYDLGFVNLLLNGVFLGIPIATGLALLNSCLNPLLYVFMGQNFRDVFRSSVLKVMEKVFAEEPSQNNTSTNPERTRLQNALNDTQV